METPARTAEDIIGIVPHTLGYTPRDSLVAVIVGTEEGGGASSATTMRTDFSLETAARILAEGGRWYVDLISRACTVTGVFLLVYDEDYVDDDPAGGWGSLFDGPSGSGATAELRAYEDAGVHRGLVRAAIDELAETFAARGIDTLSAWWISADQFGRIDESVENSRPLALATASACATELVAGGSNPVAGPEDLIIRPISAAEFSEARAGLIEQWMDIAEAFEIIAGIYPRLNEIRTTTADGAAAQLRELMDLTTVMAVDAILSEKWSRDALEMILSFDHPNFLPKAVLGCEEGGLYERARRFGTAADSAQQLVGLSVRPPAPRDVMLGIAFLKEYVAVGHPKVRATAYAVIAWFEWSLGGSTMAESYARTSLDLEPGHGLAGLIRNAVEAGLLPRWLMERKPSPF